MKACFPRLIETTHRRAEHGRPFWCDCLWINRSLSVSSCLTL